MKYYLYIFYIFSVLGFIMEGILEMVKGSRIHSGIFTGPWCPVYGFGVILIILMFNYIEKAHFPIWLNVILMFTASFVMLSVIECIGGILIEKIFGITFWNYNHLKWNIGKYIALEISLSWGVLSLVLYYFIIPFVDKLIKILPTWPLYILVILSLIDVSFSSFNLLKKK